MTKNTIGDLIQLSRKAGERFDLVQAGGGNSSAKFSDGTMLVKASGLRLSDIRDKSGFALIDNLKMRSLFQSIDWQVLEKKERELTASQIVSECNLTPNSRPSIETLLHSFGEGFGLHTHPISILSYFSTNQSNIELPNFAFVEYKTPGIDLAIEMAKSRKDYIEDNGKEPEAFILRNHGLVVFGATLDCTLAKTEEICNLIVERLRITEAIKPYALVNKISSIAESLIGEMFVTYLSEIRYEVVSNHIPFFPDGVVYLGSKILTTTIQNLETDIRNYFAIYGFTPKMITIDNRIYFTGTSFSKARESEEVWLLHKASLSYASDKIISLSESEIHYLSHWEAEKYRQKL